MRETIHRIKIYTAARKEHFHLLGGSTIFRLFVAQVLVSAFALGVHYADQLWWGGTTYGYLPFWVLLSEIIFVPAGLQLNMLREFAKDRDLCPDAPTSSLRIAHRRSMQLKYRGLIVAFAAPRDPKSLAEELKEQWHSHRATQKDIRIAKGVQIRGLFRLPSSGVFAGYLIGGVGLVATLLVALLQREDLISSLPDSWAYFKTLMILSVAPIVALVILVPVAWNGLRASGLSLRESLDDDYLSDRSFFTFIEDLFELHDRSTPRLLFNTSGRVYWSIRILTAPIPRLAIVIRQARRSGRVGKLRNKGHYINYGCTTLKSTTSPINLESPLPTDQASHSAP